MQHINKKVILLAAAVLAGVVLILLSNKATTSSAESDRAPTLSDEEKIRRIVESIDGVSEAEVIITEETEYVPAFAGSEGKPKIVGIGITAKGADDVRVQKKLIWLLSTAYNISTNMIYICGK